MLSKTTIDSFDLWKCEWWSSERKLAYTRDTTTDFDVDEPEEVITSDDQEISSPDACDHVIQVKTDVKSFRKYLTISDVPSAYSHLPLSVLSNSVGCVNVILDVLFIHGLLPPSPLNLPYSARFYKSCIQVLERSLSFWLVSKGLDSWIKFWKYKTAAYFSAMEKDILPAVPNGLEGDNPKYIFGGVIGRFMRLHHRHFPGSLDISILMSKKGMPRASKELIRHAEIATVTFLTQKRPKEDATVLDNPWLAPNNQVPSCRETTNGLIVGPDQVRYQIRRTVREHFNGHEFGVRQMSTPVFPSTSANYNNTRSRGGAVGPIKALCSDLGFEPKTASGDLFAYDPINMDYGEKGLKTEEGLFPNNNEEFPFTYMDQEDFLATYKRVYWRNYKAALGELPVVKAVGLPEPLKIRVISKGPVHTYFVLKSFQKFLWRTLKNLPAYELIGRPVSTEDIERVCGFLSPYMVSGDYQASTDNILKYVTDCVMEELGAVLELPQTFMELCSAALTGHIFQDDSFITPDNPEGLRVQRTGQLMGSIISFPILCIINFAMCRWSMECAERRTIYASNIPCLVNGDDCLLASTSPDIMYWWRSLTRLVGLKESVGKTYFNRRFAVINSVHHDFVDGRWIQRKYVNMGLVKGLSRSGEREDSTPFQAANCYNELHGMTPDDLWEGTERAFFQYNSNLLKTFDGPWYLPTYAGGLGLRKMPSTFDRIVLRKIQNHYVDKVLDGNDKAEWMVRSLAREAMRNSFPLLKEVGYKRVLCRSEVDLESCEIDLDAMFSWFALLKFSLKDLKLKLCKTKERRDLVLRRNAWVYQSASRDAREHPCRPVGEDFIWEEKKSGFLNAITVF